MVGGELSVEGQERSCHFEKMEEVGLIYMYAVVCVKY